MMIFVYMKIAAQIVNKLLMISSVYNIVKVCLLIILEMVKLINIIHHQDMKLKKQFQIQNQSVIIKNIIY